MENAIKEILKTLDSSINAFQDSIPGLESIIFDELQPLIKELMVKNGKIINNINNLKLIGQIKNKLHKIIINPDYKDSVIQFVESFNLISYQNINYFSQLGQRYKPSKILAMVKNLAIEQTINDLVGQGMTDSIIGPIEQILKDNIITGGDYASFTKQMQNSIISTDKSAGILGKYTKQITTDAIHQYNAQYQETIAQDLQFNWGQYVGSNLTTTREFCFLMTKKRWTHKSELQEIIKGQIDGKQCKLSKTTGLPLGMIPGTDAANFKVRRGGYNCGHQFFWVPDDVIPANLLALHPR